jgi:simple sugar transport system ATP-binding protein
VAVRLQGISKTFGATKALQNVHIEIGAGEVHALLGENGAGKTTLMLVLAGILRPDAGAVEIGGRFVELHSRKDGAKRGIGIVQQHYGLVEELTGTENYLLGHPTAPLWPSKKAARAALLRASADFGLAIDPERRVIELTIGERQRLEILIALATGADIIIFDEPTAALASSDIEQLTGLVRRLADQGKAVVYITHKLREVLTVADRVTVMRRGEVAVTLGRAELDTDTLTRAMIGRLPSVEKAVSQAPGDIVADLRKIAVSPDEFRSGLADISFRVRRSEIVGVAGVLGSGQDVLAELLCGLREPDAGEMARRPTVAAYIPEDRARDGIAPLLSILDNAIVHRHRDPALRRLGWLDRSRTADFARGLVAEGRIAAQSVHMRAGALSGGNQQKLVVAREFARKPDLIVAHNPYRGLDIGAAAEVRHRLLAARDEGCGIVLISPDLDELFDLADRIIVLSHGRLVGTADPQTVTAEQLGALMSGTPSLDGAS